MGIFFFLNDCTVKLKNILLVPCHGKDYTFWDIFFEENSVSCG